MNTNIHVRPSNVAQLREALRPLLDISTHDFPTDDDWLELATSYVYNRLAAERPPYPMLPPPDLDLIDTMGDGRVR